MPFLLPQLPYRNSSTLFTPTGQAQIYEVPDNAAMLMILCVGAGGAFGGVARVHPLHQACPKTGWPPAPALPPAAPSLWGQSP